MKNKLTTRPLYHFVLYPSVEAVRNQLNTAVIARLVQIAIGVVLTLIAFVIA